MGLWDRLRQLADVGLNGRSPAPLAPFRPIPGTTREAHDPELLRTLPRAVYADWLTERGDVRGLLVGVDDPEETQMFVEAFPDHFYGPFARCERRYLHAHETFTEQADPRNTDRWVVGSDPLLQIEWREGFVSRLALDLSVPTTPMLLTRAIAHPSLAVLETLRVTSRQRSWEIDQLPDLQPVVRIRHVHTDDDTLRRWLAPIQAG